jgi:hypothetical protein
MIHRQRVNFALILEYAQGLDLLPIMVVTVSNFQFDSIGNCKGATKYRRYLYC